MTENDETPFVPRSDEDLARLLENQLAAMRGQTAPIEPVAFDEITVTQTVSVADAGSSLDSDVADIFGALLDETAPEVVAEVPIPMMFGDASAADAEYLAAVFDEPVPAVAATFVSETIVTETVVDVSEESVVETVTEVAFDEYLLAATEQVPVQSPEPVLPMAQTNPVVTFAPRPSFDELVFGVTADE